MVRLPAQLRDQLHVNYTPAKQAMVASYRSRNSLAAKRVWYGLRAPRRGAEVIARWLRQQEGAKHDGR